MRRNYFIRHPFESLIVVAAITVGVLLWRRDRQPPNPARFPTVSRLTPGDTVKSYQEITLTYIGDLQCAQCVSDEFRRDLRATVSALRDNLEAQGRLFSTTGVIVTPDLEASSSYLLEDEDLWDELSIGSSWLNSRAGYFAWEVGVAPATPTLITQVRTIKLAPNGYLQVDEAQTLRVLSGASEVRAMVSQGNWARLLPNLEGTGEP